MNMNDKAFDATFVAFLMNRYAIDITEAKRRVHTWRVMNQLATIVEDENK